MVALPTSTSISAVLNEWSGSCRFTWFRGYQYCNLRSDETGSSYELSCFISLVYFPTSLVPWGLEVLLRTGVWLVPWGYGGLTSVGFLWTLEFVSWEDSNVNPSRVLWRGYFNLCIRGRGGVGELFLVV